MKNYCKTWLFLCCFALVAGMSQAQVKFGIKAGANGSSLIGFEKVHNFLVSDAENITTTMIFNYQAGLSLDLAVGKLFIRPDLEFSTQGFGTTLKSAGSTADTTKYNLYYLKLPVHIGYKHALNMDTDLRFGVGGYAGYLIYGNVEDLFNKLDYGLSAIVALDYVNTSTSINYEYGLVDMIGVDGWSNYRKENKLPVVRNSCFKISFAYYF